MDGSDQTGIDAGALKAEECQFKLIEAAVADELPPTIKTFYVDEFNKAALAQAITMARGTGVQVVQIETPPLHEELRAFSDRLLRERTDHCGQDFNQRSNACTLVDQVSSSLDKYLADYTGLDPALRDEWKEMQLANTLVASELYPGARMRAIFRRSMVSHYTVLAMHSHPSNIGERKSCYLNLTHGKAGTVFPDPRDMILVPGRKPLFTTPHPRLWVSKTYNARPLFTTEEQPQGGALHGPAFGPLLDRSVGRETQTVEFPCDLSEIS